ncbi:LysR family transcriptional regulator [Algoriphagus kandeliae]|uniref:LysR family transcriptional regulator n=1 Tax=Algoriphagus kandeliae TaxID=2562278 RepID=A0A4Y9QT79_9BACT|nr:LysR family transcriptional regulator [Algoriphagus kandeliae]TFV95659.1 LysR family transcriptional regulator [Algoriphagus kandeliae]
MNYTINQLRVFLKVIETESITKASEELFMTQPAVSIQLKNFQSQFKFPLTEVVGRQLYVTEFGYEVAEIARRIFDELEALKYKTKEYEGIFTGRLRISVASTGKYVIPFFLTDFLNAHKGIDLVLDVTNKSKVVESLKNNEIDFAVVSVLPEEVEVEEVLLMENKLYLVGNTDNYSKNKTLIYREEGSATRQVMEQYFDKKGSKRKQIELTSNEAVKQAVLAGIGHSILPLIGIKSELIEGSLKIIRKRGLPLKTDWRLIWLKDKKLSPVANAYLEHVRKEKAKIQKKYFKWYLDFE